MATENWLENLRIGEISLVPDMSNPEADIVIMKAGKGARAPSTDLGNALDGLDDDTRAKIEKMFSPMIEAKLRKAAIAEAERIFTEFGALRDVLTATNGDAVLTDVQKARIIPTLDNCGAVLSDVVPTASISKAVIAAMASVSGDEDIAKIAKEFSMNIDKVNEALETAEATIGKLKADLASRDAEIVGLRKAAATVNAEDSDDAIIAKMADGPAKELLKRTLTQRAADTAAIQKMADDKGISDMVTVLKTGGVPEFDKVGPALFRIEKGRPLGERTEKVDGKDVVFAADAEIVKSALLKKIAGAKAPLKAVGSDVAVNKSGVGTVGDSGDGETAIEKMSAKVVEIRKGNAALTEAAAFVQAMNENPALYAQYMRERHPGTGSAASSVR